MAIDASAIRAGQAFVEMFIEDETVQATLAKVETRLRGFGATAAAISTSAVTAVGAATATVSSSVAAAGATVLRVFRGITSSVLAATASLGGMALVIGSIAPRSKLNGLLTGFLNNSATTEATGRWTRFLGMLTGNQMLRGLGTRIERLGLASAVIRGFSSGGIGGGIAATIGAGLRSARSVLTSTIASALSAPIRGAMGLLKGSVGSVIPGVMGETGAAAGGMLQASGAAGALARTVGSVGTSLLGVAAKAGGFAAVISGAAVGAAKQFVSAAQDMVKTSRETGESLQTLIEKKFGQNSLISSGDIEAAAKLGDLMTMLKQSVAAAWAQIGAAALPILQAITERGIAVATTVTRIIAQNRQLVTTVISIAGRVAGIAGAIAAVGAGLAIAGPALSVILSPLGLLTAGLATVVYLFPQIRTAAADAFGYLFPNFTELTTIVRETIGGITDALMGGDLKAAAEVLWAGLEVAWRAGGSKLIELWRDSVAGFRQVWVHTLQFFGDAWQTILGGIRSAWQSTQDWLARGFARVIANVSGQNVDEVLATINEMQEADRKGRDEAFAREMQDREAIAKQKLEDIAKERDEQGKADQEKLDAARERFRASRERARGLRPEASSAATAATQTTSALASGFGSFSTFGLGQIGVGGLGDLKESSRKTAENTEKLVNLMERQSGAQFA